MVSEILNTSDILDVYNGYPVMLLLPVTTPKGWSSFVERETSDRHEFNTVRRPEASVTTASLAHLTTENELSTRH